MTEVNIEDILSQLDKHTLSMVRMGRDISNIKIPTASFGINLLTGGGLHIGKQHTFWGNEQSGKSALALQTVAVNQALGIPCGYIDSENSFDPVWAGRLGVDVDKLMVSRASRISDVANVQANLIRAGAKLMIVDSTSVLKPSSYYSEDELKDFEKTRQIGQFAKDFGNMCSYVQSMNYTCAVMHISQVRMDLGNSFMPGMKPSGGKEAEHTDQFRIRMFSSKSEKQAIMGQVQVGNQMIEERIGRMVTWTVDKNKLNGRYGTGEYGLYVLGDRVGIDRASELVAYGLKYGIIQKGGAWYTIYDERFQGDTKTKDFVRENKEVAEKLEAEILAQSV